MLINQLTVRVQLMTEILTGWSTDLHSGWVIDYLVEWLVYVAHQRLTDCVTECLTDFIVSPGNKLDVCMFLLFGFAWRDVEWRPRRSQRLGEEIHPHHQTPLTNSTNSQSKGSNWHTVKPCIYLNVGVYYLLYIRLQWAVQRSGFHMFRYQSHCPQDVKGESLLKWAEVTLGHIFVIWKHTDGH